MRFHFTPIVRLLAALLVIDFVLTNESAAECVGYDRVVALCIGIDRFQDSNIPAVDYGEADAQAMANLLKDRYGYVKVELIGKQATKQAIRQKLRSLNQQLGEKDALVVFISTHGQVLYGEDRRRHGFLLTYDSNLSGDQVLVDGNRGAVADRVYKKSEVAVWEDQTLGMSDLVDSIQESKAKDVLLIVDACYSGFLSARDLGGAIPQLLNDRTSRIILSACAQDQKAYPDKNAKHGYFTAALLDQLDGRSALTLTEVFRNARDKVAKDSGGNMLPMMAMVGGDGGEMVFLPHRYVDPKDVELVLKQLDARARDVLGIGIKLDDLTRASFAQDYRYAVDPEMDEVFWTGQFERFRNAATLGDPLAMAGLHYLYSKGLGVKKSDAEALFWARRALESQQPVGEHVMGRCLLTGIGVEKNALAAKQHLKRARDNGYTYSGVSLAILQMKDRQLAEIPSAEIKAIEVELERAIKDKIPVASRILGRLMLYSYEHRKADPWRALRLFEQAVKHGDEFTRVFIAEVLTEFDEPGKDPTRAGKEILAAANAGVAHAQYVASMQLLEESGVSTFGWTPDNVKAREYATLAANQGHRDGMMVLAEIYENGWGGPVNLNMARTWCEKAAEKNLPRAFFRQGFWYLTGTVYPQSNPKAFTAFTRAARAGDEFGCLYLASMHHDGIGFGQNNANPRLHLHTALYWYMRAYQIAKLDAAKKELEGFRGELNLERRGFSLGKFPPASMILTKFEKEHPKEAAEFVNEFWPRKGRPQEKKMHTLIDVKSTSRLLLAGTAVAKNEKLALEAARQAAWKSVLQNVLLPNSSPENLRNAERVALSAFGNADSSVHSTNLERSVETMICIAVDRDEVTTQLTKQGVKVGDAEEGLFASDLKQIESRDHSRRSLESILSRVQDMVVRVERGPRPKLSDDKRRVELQPTIQVDKDSYRKLARHVEFALENWAVRMGRYDLDITTDKKGYIKFVWPHDRPHDMMQTRRISFFSYLPDAVSEWPPNKNGQTPLFLIRDMELKEGGKGTAQLTYAVLPTDLDVLKIKDSLKLECGLSDKDDQPVIQKSTADARQIFGSFRTSYSPGNAFGNGNTLMMMPMLGTNVFYGRMSRSIRVSIDRPTEKGRNARSWFARLKP